MGWSSGLRGAAEARQGREMQEGFHIGEGFEVDEQFKGRQGDDDFGFAVWVAEFLGILSVELGGK